MSHPRVTVTVGRGGQRTATVASGGMYSDRPGGAVESRKRSVKDRLGSSLRNISPLGYQGTSKRQRQEGGWRSSAYDDNDDDDDDMTPASIQSKKLPFDLRSNKEDLRHKLDQKNSLRNRQFMNGQASGVTDLRERISRPLPVPQGPRVILRRPPPLPLKGVPAVGALPPPNVVLPHINTLPKPPAVVEKADISSLLKSLGLSKYIIMFQAEEVDMAALRTMSDNDLKELGLPMGPRKKILLALSSRKF